MAGEGLGGGMREPGGGAELESARRAPVLSGRRGEKVLQPDGSGEAFRAEGTTSKAQGWWSWSRVGKAHTKPCGQGGAAGSQAGTWKMAGPPREIQHLSQPTVLYSGGNKLSGKEPSLPGTWGSGVSGVTLKHSDSKLDQRSGSWHREETQRCHDAVDIVLTGQAWVANDS